MSTKTLFSVLLGVGLISLLGAAMTYASNCNLTLTGPLDRQWVPTRVLVQGTGTPDSSLIVLAEKLDEQGRVLSAQSLTRHVDLDGNFRFHITLNPTDLPLSEQSFRVTVSNPDPQSGMCAPIVVKLFPTVR